MKNFGRVVRFAVAIGLGSLATASRPVEAGLIGTSVSGLLQFPTEGSYPANAFDPANNNVPSGYGNSAPGGPTVTIANPLVEFGFANIIGLTHTANFTDNTLTISTTTSPQQSGYDTFRETFTDQSFYNLYLLSSSSTYPNTVTVTLTSTTLTINESIYLGAGSFSDTISFGQFATVPEPSSLLLCCIAGCFVLIAARRRLAITPSATS